MVIRGVHFALSDADAQSLFDCPEDDRPDLISEEIEENYFDNSREWLCETDKAWDAIHRALAENDLSYIYKKPLDGVVMGGEQLYFGDDYIISFKDSSKVKDIAAQLDGVDEADFKRRYYETDQEDDGISLSDENFDYTWSNLVDLIDFYKRAAEANRSVIFTADR